MANKSMCIIGNHRGPFVGEQTSFYIVIKGLRFAGQAIWAEQTSLGRCKIQQMTIILILSYIAKFHIEYRDIELITKKKHQQLHARCDICKSCLATVSIWRISE